MSRTFAPGAAFAAIRFWRDGSPQFIRTEHPEIRPAAQHAGNATDAHIAHPKLGQIPTEGNRFAAIIKASNHLHGLQSGERFANEMRQRVWRQTGYFLAPEDRG